MKVCDLGFFVGFGNDFLFWEVGGSMGKGVVFGFVVWVFSPFQIQPMI